MLDAISSLLEPYSNAPVECDGFTRIAHSVLAGAGIPHSCMQGQLVSASGNDELPIHFWIQLDDGRVIDYRARMWLGDDAGVPHGVSRWVSTRSGITWAPKSLCRYSAPR